MALIACKDCGNHISREAKSCPKCGAPPPPPKPKSYAGWFFYPAVLAVIVLSVMLSDSGGKDKQGGRSSSQASTKTQNAQASPASMQKQSTARPSAVEDAPNRLNTNIFSNQTVQDQFEGSMTVAQEKQLTAFGIRATLGMAARPQDIKQRLSRSELAEMIATGLNSNGLLCAKLVRVQALARDGYYETSCIAYRGGSAKKQYVIETAAGIAFEE